MDNQLILNFYGIIICLMNISIKTLIKDGEFHLFK
jgi:hypothetical protein